METISPNLVKELRTQTGAPIMDCKEALQSTGGDIERAKIYLREKGKDKAKSKSSRTTKEGLVGSYIHGGGKIGVLVEVNCETDFVAKTDRFQQFVEDVAMQIAAAAPKFLSESDVPKDLLDQEADIYRKQAVHEGKPEAIAEKIVVGKIKNFYADNCLLNQVFIKDSAKTIQSYLTGLVAVLGENVTIRRFSRFQLGSES